MTKPRQPIARREADRPLFGLILAGGKSARMGIDKGTIEYYGVPHVRYLSGLLGEFCERVLVSINRAQRDRAPYSGLPVIVDAAPGHGPASGLLAAAACDRGKAWLVVAVDLAALCRRTLAELVRHRRSSAAATAFRHTDGTLEPLCAIWEPRACEVLAARAAAGDFSPRRCLEAVDVALVACTDPTTLRSVDSAAAREVLKVRGQGS